MSHIGIYISMSTQCSIAKSRLHFRRIVLASRTGLVTPSPVICVFSHSYSVVHIVSACSSPPVYLSNMVVYSLLPRILFCDSALSSHCVLDDMVHFLHALFTSLAAMLL
jgi:hypothetical protein